MWREATGLRLPVAPVPFPVETGPERLAGEAWATSLPVGGHLMAPQRAALDARRVLPGAALATVAAGREVAIAGRLVILQRPLTARGVAFATIEDETGLGNLVLATGRVQRKETVVSPQVTGVAPLWPEAKVRVAQLRPLSAHRTDRTARAIPEPMRRRLLASRDDGRPPRSPTGIVSCRGRDQHGGDIGEHDRRGGHTLAVPG